MSSQGILFRLALLTTFAFTTGCYTQLASNEGDYWGYTGEVKRSQPRNQEITRAEAPADTSIVATQQLEVDRTPVRILDEKKSTEGSFTNTVINNYYPTPYYDPYAFAYDHLHDRWRRGYWDHYRYQPSVVIILGRDPFWGHSNYQPWYAYSPWYPYDNWYHTSYHGYGWYRVDPFYSYPPMGYFGYACSAPAYHPWGYGYGGNDWASNHDGTTKPGNVRTGRIGGGEDRGNSGGGRSGGRSQVAVEGPTKPTLIGVTSDRGAATALSGTGRSTKVNSGLDVDGTVGVRATLDGNVTTLVARGSKETVATTTMGRSSMTSPVGTSKPVETTDDVASTTDGTAKASPDAESAPVVRSRERAVEVSNTVPMGAGTGTTRTREARPSSSPAWESTSTSSPRQSSSDATSSSSDTRPTNSGSSSSSTSSGSSSGSNSTGSRTPGRSGR